MSDLAVQEGAGAAAAVPLSWSQGPEALPPADSSSPSSGLDRLTPESSDEDLGQEHEGLAMDPLSNSSSDDDSSDDDGGYELRRRDSREVDVAGGRLRHAFTYTAEEERAVVDKFDRRLVLFVAFLYMLSFLDRSSGSTLPLPALFITPLRPFLAECGLFLNPNSGSCVRPPGSAPSSSNLLRWGPKV